MQYIAHLKQECESNIGKTSNSALLSTFLYIFTGDNDTGLQLGRIMQWRGNDQVTIYKIKTLNNHPLENITKKVHLQVSYANPET